MSGVGADGSDGSETYEVRSYQTRRRRPREPRKGGDGVEDGAAGVLHVICVAVAGPALQALGLPKLDAHLFIFWYALLSTITPPVCGAVFIAAGMVGENWLRVSIKAMSLGLGLYLIPLAMVANPDLIALESAPTAAIAAFVKVAVGLGLVSAGVVRPLGYPRRASLIALGACLLALPLRVA